MNVTGTPLQISLAEGSTVIVGDKPELILMITLLEGTGLIQVVLPFPVTRQYTVSLADNAVLLKLLLLVRGIILPKSILA